jgi:uncharacterized protein
MKRQYIASILFAVLGLAVVPQMARSQVNSVNAYAYKSRDYEGKKKILWIGGGDSHDTLICAAALRPLVEQSGKYFVVYTEDYDSLKQLAPYSAVVYAAMVRALTPEQENSLATAVKNGMPVIGLHGATASFPSKYRAAPVIAQPANGTKERSTEFRPTIDLTKFKDFQDPTRFDRHKQIFTMFGGEFYGHPPLQEIKVRVKDGSHPAVKGVTDFAVMDELYMHRNMQDDIRVLLEAEFAGQRVPVAWVKQYGKGKVFFLALGHDPRSVTLEPYGKMVIQALQWALEE